jgi:hypothetical protein
LHTKARACQKDIAAPKPGKTAWMLGNLKFPHRQLHNFRVTGLCTSCTRLMNKQLQMREFR